MAEHNYKFNITMTCGGCSGAVERVLKKLDGKAIALPEPHS
jgi:copper chaperone